jgi:hypothetical protein
MACMTWAACTEDLIALMVGNLSDNNTLVSNPGGDCYLYLVSALGSSGNGEADCCIH